MMRGHFVAGSLGGLLACSLAAAEVPATVDPALIPQYRVVQADIATSAQPTARGLADLARLGFRTVVNLRTPAEGTSGERRVVEAQGMRYVAIPIGRTIPRAAAEELDALLRDPGAGPMLVHCASGNRAGGLWAALQVIRGHSADEAEREGRRAGLRSRQLVLAVRDLARQRSAQ